MSTDIINHTVVTFSRLLISFYRDVYMYNLFNKFGERRYYFKTIFLDDVTRRMYNCVRKNKIK